MDRMTWTKQADGSFEKSGQLPEGCTEVQLQAGNGKPFSLRSSTPADAIAFMEDAVKKNQLKNNDVYHIIPVMAEPREIKVQVENLTEAEVLRVNAIQTEKNIDRVAAIKLMKKEQRDAGKPVKAAKPSGVASEKKPKYDVEQFKTIFTANANKPLKETVKLIMDATGASECFIRFKLKGFGLIPSKGVQSPTTNAGVVA